MKNFALTTMPWHRYALALPTRGTGAFCCPANAAVGGTERVVRERHALGTSVWRPAIC